MDGNGRMARFIMNAMLASGGYPWTVIPVEERDRYMKALEAASVEQNIQPFAAFVGWLVQEGMKGTPVAKVKTDEVSNLEREYPPYHFYSNPNGVKQKTAPLFVDGQYRTLRLYNIHLKPMEVKDNLFILVEFSRNGKREEYPFNLSELYQNPKLPEHLFFINGNEDFIDIELPEGIKEITISVKPISGVQSFDLDLACEYR